MKKFNLMAGLLVVLSLSSFQVAHADGATPLQRQDIVNFSGEKSLVATDTANVNRLQSDLVDAIANEMSEFTGAGVSGVIGGIATGALALTPAVPLAVAVGAGTAGVTGSLVTAGSVSAVHAHRIGEELKQDRRALALDSVKLEQDKALLETDGLPQSEVASMEK